MFPNTSKSFGIHKVPTIHSCWFSTLQKPIFASLISLSYTIPAFFRVSSACAESVRKTAAGLSFSQVSFQWELNVLLFYKSPESPSLLFLPEQRMCLATFLCLRRSLATPTLYAAVCILSGAFLY